jgi:hypothetical protein
LECARRQPPRVGRAALRSQAEQSYRDATEFIRQQILKGRATERMTFISESQARASERLGKLSFVLVAFLPDK